MANDPAAAWTLGCSIVRALYKSGKIDATDLDSIEREMVAHGQRYLDSEVHGEDAHKSIRQGLWSIKAVKAELTGGTPPAEPYPF